MKYLLLLFILFFIGCKDECDGLSEVKIHVKPNGNGFDLYKIDKCGNQVNHLEYWGKNTDTLKAMMKGVSKETPVSVTY